VGQFSGIVKSSANVLANCLVAGWGRGGYHFHCSHAPRGSNPGPLRGLGGRGASGVRSHAERGNDGNDGKVSTGYASIPRLCHEWI
jgi:hypothetical protein